MYAEQEHKNRQWARAASLEWKSESIIVIICLFSEGLICTGNRTLTIHNFDFFWGDLLESHLFENGLFVYLAVQIQKKGGKVESLFVCLYSHHTANPPDKFRTHTSGEQQWSDREAPGATALPQWTENPFFPFFLSFLGGEYWHISITHWGKQAQYIHKQDGYGGVPGWCTLRVDTVIILVFVTNMTSNIHVNNVT